MDKQKRQDIIIKACCVIAALTLWVYIRNTENPVSTQLIKYVPVDVVNLDTLEDKDLVAVPGQEFYVNLNIKAPDSIARNIDKNKDFKLQVDVKDYALKAGETKIPVTVKESPSGVSILNPDGLLVKIEVDNLVEINVPTTTNVVGKVADGFYNDNVTMSLDTVRVTGPEKLLKSVKSVSGDIDIKDAKADINKIVKLKAVDANGKEVSDVKINPDYAQVSVQVSKGRVLEVQVKTKGAPSSGVSIETIEAIPKAVEVSGDTEVIDQVRTLSTETIDLNSINQDTTIDTNLIVPSGIKITNNNYKVKVKITVNKLQEKTVSIPIKYINLGEKLTVEVKEPTVNLTLTGQESQLDSLVLDNIVANIDLQGLKEGDHSVELKLTGIPNGINIKSQSINNVNITIKNIPEETNNNGS